MSHQPPQLERLALSRELGEFLVELSIALHKHAMYPSGHPSLGPAVAGVTRRAERLLETRSTFAFGVARRQLIIEGVATDSAQPVLRRLAEGLHRHHLGAVSFSRGLQAREVGSALVALASDAERDGALGLAERLPEWPHIRVHPLTFDRLELVEAAPDVADSRGADGGRAAELWIGLARASMAACEPGESPDAMVDPVVVAKAIDTHQGAAAYDQVIVGYMLQIAAELKTAPDAEAAALRRRTARLIAALKPETLRRLVDMGGDTAQRRAFVADAAGGMAVDAVLEIVKAAAEASGQTISHGLVRMLSKLAVHAEAGQQDVRPLADSALREQVQRLLSEWQLADPNPDAYGKVLQHLATTAPAPTARASVQHADHQDALRIVQMSLEIDAFGPLAERAIDGLVADGLLPSILEMLASPPAGSGSAAEAMMARLRTPTSIARLLARSAPDLDSLDRLFPGISLEGYATVLDALVNTENRSVRRKLLDRLARTELDVGSLVAARLDDERWYVQRNMLVLLQRLGRLPASFSPGPWTRHRDARVRYEAIQLQLSLPVERALALQTALDDSDSRVLRLGLTHLQQGCLASLVPRVIAAALNPGLAEEVRVLAVRALEASRDRRALEPLLRFVDGGRSFRGRPRLAPRTPLSLAALRALATGWPRDPRAGMMLELAAGSSDPEIRDAAARVVAS
ncbi:MAG TPA: hypothetical protein VD833_10390 [Vicinamibacterales bacterium]|nr:hypothetical protein [Vicinamibacterales bacterium]